MNKHTIPENIKEKIRKYALPLMLTIGVAAGSTGYYAGYVAGYKGGVKEEKHLTRLRDKKVVNLLEKPLKVIDHHMYPTMKKCDSLETAYYRWEEKHMYEYEPYVLGKPMIKNPEYAALQTKYHVALTEAQKFYADQSALVDARFKLMDLLNMSIGDIVDDTTK